MGERSLIRPNLLQSNFQPHSIHSIYSIYPKQRRASCIHAYTHTRSRIYRIYSTRSFRFTPNQDGTHLRVHLRPLATFILSLIAPYPYPLNRYLTYLFRAMCRELECCSPRSPRQVRTLSRFRLGQSDACHWLIDPCSDSGFTASSS